MENERRGLVGITRIGNPDMRQTRASGDLGTEMSSRKWGNVLIAESWDTGAESAKPHLGKGAGVRGRHNKERD